jgi:hypothetical protein
MRTSRSYFAVSVVVSLAAAWVLPSYAAAFSVVRSEDGSSGAVVYLTPGDDPVAGMPGVAHYELQKPVSDHANVALAIRTSDGGVNHSSPASIHDGKVAAAYEFALRGRYELTLTVTEPGLQPVRYVQSVVVSRNNKAEDRRTPAWAPFGVAGGLMLMLAPGVKTWQKLR